MVGLPLVDEVSKNGPAEVHYRRCHWPSRMSVSSQGAAGAHGEAHDHVDVESRQLGREIRETFGAVMRVTLLMTRFPRSTYPSFRNPSLNAPSDSGSGSMASHPILSNDGIMPP